MLSLDQGGKLVNLAREAIKCYVSRKQFVVNSKIKSEFSEHSGAFVTIEKNGMLRGCIGITEPVYPLYQAVSDAAISAASSDPRFPPLSKEEFKEIEITVSVLTKPSLIEVQYPEQYLEKIKVGEDGLLIKGTNGSGLLLPIVAVEQNWDALTFLNQTCVKAGLPPDSWKDFDNVRVYKFQSEVFTEKSS